MIQPVLLLALGGADNYSVSQGAFLNINEDKRFNEVNDIKKGRNQPAFHL